MIVRKLYLYCSSGEVVTLIEFIEQIKEVLVENHGEDTAQAA